VYRFRDDIGQPHQVFAQPYTGLVTIEVADQLWYHRSNWVGWIAYPHAKGGAKGRTLHMEHVCTTWA
jgi:hypothetical protein